ncbi:unnamed protein product [Prunus armeniaca]|uniref:Retrotransposon gag domain-containing protein n=1 Tax=Prunus armeniaca TaxID=36596 RepID=A0A6J5TJH3_PRUAR|nr:unnamed protein product [Prunus armeniaca]
MPVAEYIAKFEEFMLRCDIREDQRMTLSRFRSGLRLELQRELIPHTVNTLERVFQKVQELEKYLKSSNIVKRVDPYKSDFRAGTSGTKPNATCKGFTMTSSEDSYEPQQPAEDCGNDFEAPHPTLSVVRCTLVQPRKETEDWHRTSIFHTYIKSGDKDWKVIIDNGSCINVVSTLTVSRLGLSTEEHPEPHKVAWIDNTSSIPVTQ